MAETAKILNPTRKVVVPDLDGRLLAGRRLPGRAVPPLPGASYPGHTVISYINCSAAVKAMSDLICTSSNAAKMVTQCPRTARSCSRPTATWAPRSEEDRAARWCCGPAPARCTSCSRAKELAKLKVQHPDAEVLAHPECDEAVLQHAELRRLDHGHHQARRGLDGEDLIIATEPGVFHQIQKKVPDKVLIQAPGMDESCACNQCPHMRKNTLEKLYLCLRDLAPELTLDEALRKRALAPIEKMLALS